MSSEKYFKKRILIADDLPNMRADLKNILINLGFTNIKEVADGQAAWDKLTLEAELGRPYDVIFSDINMPEMNGLVLLKKLRATAAYKKVPIFMVSTENEKHIIVEAIVNGATDYILKPYGPDIVKEKIIAKLKWD